MNYNLSYREFANILKENGYTLSRQKGDHKIWVKPNSPSITINFRNPNMMVIRRLIKENNLQI